MRVYVQMVQDWLAHQPGLLLAVRRGQRKGTAVPRYSHSAPGTLQGLSCAYSAKVAVAEATPVTQCVASSKLSEP